MDFAQILSSDGFLNPQLSLETQTFFRVSYAALLLFWLVTMLPQWRRYFLSDRFGGYAQSSRFVDLTHNPISAIVLAAVWFASAEMLIAGTACVLASFSNLLLCRHYFIQMRWKGVARGLGAPGFIAYWLAAAVFLLELSLHFAPDLRSLTVLVLQVDFAFIMLSAGIYKFTAGYPKNHGMELGMANPEWGYWWLFYKNLPPSSLLFRVLNHLAWSTEVVAGILMLLPPTRFLGGMLILLSFIFIASQIRLALLCPMVMVCCFLFFHPGSLADSLIKQIIPAVQAPVAQQEPIVHAILGAFLWSYLVLLPLAHAGLFCNFYARKTLPRVLQAALEKYTNFFGLIIWRVFSVDVTNFFILIHQEARAGGQRTLVSRYGWQGGLRYNFVCESIAVTSLFTTLKYYPSNDELFVARLLRYARTVPCPKAAVLIFEYVSMGKTDSSFTFETVSEFTVDLEAGTVTEKVLKRDFSVRDPHAASPVHAGVRPGSYVHSGG